MREGKLIRFRPTGRNPDEIRRTLAALMDNRDVLDADAMDREDFDPDDDGKIDLAAGGTGKDFSGILKGSVLVCNANGALVLIQSGDLRKVPAVQADGTIAWEDILATKQAPDPVGFAVPGGLATGDKAPWSPPMRTSGTILKVTAVVKTASTSGAITIDLLKSTDNGANWTTTFSTKLTLDQDERSSATAGTPAVLDVTTYAADDLFRINIDGAGTGAVDLTVGLWLKEAFI